MTDAAFLDPQIGFYRRANGKRSWREERLGAVLEMIRNGDLWKPGDRLLVGLTAQAMARARDLEAEWAGSVAPAPDVLGTGKPPRSQPSLAARIRWSGPGRR